MADLELYIDSVQHHYNGRNILTGIFLTCKPGEIIGLLGRNGSGKTTLLEIIFGSLKPHFKYQKMGDKLIDKGYSTGDIAYLPQVHLTPGSMRVEQAVALFGNRYKNQLLRISAIEDNLQKRFNELSGGQRRLIECLMILYSDARFVLLDEPFSQMSPHIIQEMQEHIHLLKAEKGLIVTDHYYQQIVAVSTRIILIHNGCNYAINSMADLILHGYLPNTHKV